jgi:hypothetical protein
MCQKVRRVGSEIKMPNILSDSIEPQVVDVSVMGEVYRAAVVWE